MQKKINLVNFDPTVRKIYADDANQENIVTLGAGSYISDASFEAAGGTNCHVLVGRYCSIARDVKFLIGMNHDYCNVGTYPFDEVLRNYTDGLATHAKSNKHQIVIGNDVRIGCDVIILGGVRIGNGAVIGAGAVVAKDVPPFAVVVGNPAKIIRYRFDEYTCKQLQKIKYWNWDRDKLQENLELLDEVEKFISKYKVMPNQIADESPEFIQHLRQLRERGMKIYCLPVDFDVPNPVWKKVLEEYFWRATKKDKVALVLVVTSKDKSAEDKKILDYYLRFKMSAYHSVTIFENDAPIFEWSPTLINLMDALITTREDVSSQYVDYFSDYGAEIIFGLNKNVFGKNLSYNPHELKPIPLKENEKPIANAISNFFEQGKKAIFDLIKQQRIEEAMAVLHQLSSNLYNYNQTYTDDVLEYQLSLIENIFSKGRNFTYTPNENCVLFYDYFGYDLRGLAAVYLKALVNLGYKIIYLTVAKAQGTIPTLQNILKDSNHQIVYFNQKSLVNDYIEICNVIAQTRPKHGFFYSTPWDIPGMIAFMSFNETLRRYLVNLTDHAFWLGVNTFDYCLEFRKYGTSLSANYRKIPIDKLICQPYYPFVDKSVEFQGYPFEKKSGDVILFSGGQLYKTIDDENTYYKIVGGALQKFPNLKFWYAGHGDASRLHQLMQQFPERVFHTAERKDLFALLENVDVYLNTYPLIGGLMTQYSAKAGKFPIFLKRYDANGECLLNEDELGVAFTDKEKFVKELERLITDADYRKMKGEQARHHVITEEQFTENLQKIMLHGESNFPLKFDRVNQDAFRYTYFYRFAAAHFPANR
ncbi:MAG: hypothetical protein IJT06_04785 [Selenomonadaceae bacterium]|nr:hypothetical protein [Selenomonadaceae bacterium]